MNSNHGFLLQLQNYAGSVPTYYAAIRQATYCIAQNITFTSTQILKLKISLPVAPALKNVHTYFFYAFSVFSS